MRLTPDQLRSRVKTEVPWTPLTLLTPTQVEQLSDELEGGHAMAQQVMDTLVASGRVVVWNNEWLKGDK